MKGIILAGGSGTRLTDLCKNDFAITNLDKQQSPFFSELTTLGDVRNPADLKWK
ncbi:MAG: hypothetical protein K9G70_14850 [Prolixibacteraceae bacterium]|nr:hypothetical protein [Prolixibacteraceae bacterium]